MVRGICGSSLKAQARYLPEDIKVVLDLVIQRNAYFAHPENLLLSMMTDNNKHIRELACRRIIKASTIRQATEERLLCRKSTSRPKVIMT